MHENSEILIQGAVSKAFRAHARLGAKTITHTAAALAIVVSLSACETMSDVGEAAGDVASAANPFNWFDDDEEETSTEPKPVPGSSENYPSVGTVPQKPPPPSIVQDANALQNQLVADKANAKYSAQVVQQQSNTAASTTASAVSAQTSAAQSAASQTVQRAVTPQPVPVPATTTRATPVPTRTTTTANQVASVPAPVQPVPTQPAPSYGNPIGQAVHIATLYFPQGGAQLTQNDLNVLSQVAGIYRNGGKSIKVIGHASSTSGVTDQVRQDLVNYKASLDRATSAAAALLRIGIQQDKIEIAAVGAREPRYTEETTAGIAGNQRVEVFIQY